MLMRNTHRARCLSGWDTDGRMCHEGALYYVDPILFPKLDRIVDKNYPPPATPAATNSGMVLVVQPHSPKQLTEPRLHLPLLKLNWTEVSNKGHSSRLFPC